LSPEREYADDWRTTTVLTFPLHNAALDLRGRPPEELPHGQLAIPAKVRELVELERSKHRPEVFEAAQERLVNDWTVSWYFDELGQTVLYRPTPHGPEVLAVGSEEVLTLRRTMAPEDQVKLRTFRGD
jgi:hypothetical protein